MPEYMKIAVLYGGTSSEVEISRKSGKAISEGLRRKGHLVSELDWEERRVVADSNNLHQFDVVFIGYHGGAGEDGHVQAVLEVADIPFTGSDSVSSALGMNKVLTKRLFEQAAIPSAPWCIVSKDERKENILVKMAKSGFALPAVVKPSSQGSTVGVTIAVTLQELITGIDLAFQYSDELIIEKYIRGREMTVAILGDEALPVVEVAPEGGFYDYQHKYTKGQSKYFCPADILPDVAQQLQQATLMAYKILGCRHYIRADFRLSDDNEVFCLELNTLPGMTDLSLVPMAAKEVGIEFSELVEKIAKMGCRART